jgi:hypothetical protein
MGGAATDPRAERRGSRQASERVQKGKETDMEPWVWVVIAIAAVLFLMLLFRSRGGGGRRTIVRRGGPRRRRGI